MEEGLSCEVNGYSASQEIPRILCKRTIIYRVHLSHPEPGNSSTSHALYLISWRSILISSPSTPRCFKLYFPLGFPQQNSVCASPLLPPTIILSLSPLLGPFSICGMRRWLANMVDRCECIISAVGDRRKGVVFHFGGWASYQKLLTVNFKILRYRQEILKPEQILWKDIIKEFNLFQE